MNTQASETAAGPERAATWTKIGSLHGGTVAAIAASPAWTEDHSFFAATMAGLYRSDDAGQTWSRAAEGFIGLSLAALAISPQWSSDHTLLVASIDGTIFHVVWGADGPAWTSADLHGRQVSVSALGISPAFDQDSTAFAATIGDGVLRTSDRGASWDAWNFGLLDLEVLALVISPNFAEDETLFAATASGVFRSPNAGRAWRELSFPAEAGAVLTLAVSPAFGQDQTIFAGTEEGTLYRSTDGGRRWKALEAPFDGEFLNMVQVSPRFAEDQTVLALTEAALYVSEDAGQRWTRTAATPGAMSLALPPTFAADADDLAVVAGLAQDGVLRAAGTLGAFTPANDGLAGRLLIGIDALAVADTEYMVTWGPSEGVFVSEDAGTTWRDATGDLPTVEVNDVALTGLDGAFGMLAALPDGIYRSVGDGAWQQVSPLGAHQVRLSPSFTDDQTLYAATRDRGLWISTDGGATWNGVAGLDGSQDVLTVALPPNYTRDGSVLVAVRELDGSVSIGYGKDGRWGKLANHPAAARGALIASTVVDGKTAWFAALDSALYGPLGQPGGDVGVAVDDAQPRIVALVADRSGQVFAATEAGLYVSADTGTTWRLVEDSYRHAIVALYPWHHDAALVCLGLGGDNWHLELGA